MPTFEAVENRRSDALFEKLRASLEEGEFPREAMLVERLLETGSTPTEVAAAILHHFAPAAVPPGGEEIAAPPPPRDNRPHRGKPRPFAPRPHGGGKQAKRRKIGFQVRKKPKS